MQGLVAIQRMYPRLSLTMVMKVWPEMMHVRRLQADKVRRGAARQRKNRLISETQTGLLSTPPYHYRIEYAVRSWDRFLACVTWSNVASLMSDNERIGGRPLSYGPNLSRRYGHSHFSEYNADFLCTTVKNTYPEILTDQ